MFYRVARSACLRPAKSLLRAPSAAAPSAALSTARRFAAPFASSSSSSSSASASFLRRGVAAGLAAMATVSDPAAPASSSSAPAPAPASSSSLVVHHLNKSRSQRVLMLLEELGLPYEIKTYQRDATTQLAPPELRAVHPLGKSPVVTDGDLVLAESGAILTYLVETYDADRRLAPPPTDKNATVQFRYWMHFAEGTAMNYFVFLVVFDTVEKQTPFLVRPIAKAISGAVKNSFINPNIKGVLDLMEGTLQKSTWFCGEQFTAADIQLFFVVASADAYGMFANGAYPKLAAFNKRIQERPSFKRAIERGGPFSVL